MTVAWVRQPFWQSRPVAYPGEAAHMPRSPSRKAIMTRCPRLLVVLLIWVSVSRADNWPAWRGPKGDGHTQEKDLPLKWSATENVRWKVALPAPGNSTPIVWRDRVFLTQAPENGKRALFCLARADGKQL